VKPVLTVEQKAARRALLRKRLLYKKKKAAQGSGHTPLKKMIRVMNKNITLEEWTKYRLTSVDSLALAFECIQDIYTNCIRHLTFRYHRYFLTNRLLIGSLHLRMLMGGGKSDSKVRQNTLRYVRLRSLMTEQEMISRFTEVTLHVLRRIYLKARKSGKELTISTLRARFREDIKRDWIERFQYIENDFVRTLVPIEDKVTYIKENLIDLKSSKFNSLLSDCIESGINDNEMQIVMGNFNFKQLRKDFLLLCK
jgi:hypothetical protein